MWNRYESTDTRRDWAIAPFTYAYNSNPPTKVYVNNNTATERFIGKFRREYELTPFASQQKRANPTNWPLLRYSDVLLMAAEAENEVNGPTAKALQYLNEVRARANASLITKVRLPREILPLAAICSKLVDLILTVVVLIFFMFLWIRPTGNTIFLPLTR